MANRIKRRAVVATAALLVLRLCPAAGVEHQPDRLHTQTHSFEQRLAGIFGRLLERHGTAGYEVALTVEGGLRFHSTYADLYPSGIRYEDMIVRLKLADGKVQASALEAPLQRLAQRLQVQSVGTSGIQSGADGRIRGTLETVMARQQFQGEMGQGENMRSMMRAGRQPVVNWSIGGRERINPYQQNLIIEAVPLTDALLLDLRLEEFAGQTRDDGSETDEEAVDDIERKPGNVDDPSPEPGDKLSLREAHERIAHSRAPLNLTVLRAPGQRDETDAIAPTWNSALHTVDASGLDISAERIRGRLVVTLNADPWVPKPPEPRMITVQLDAAVNAGRFETIYRAEGAQGDYEGRATGGLWVPLAGAYSTAGGDGEWQGLISGRMRPLLQAAELKRLLENGTSGTESIQDTFRSIGRLLLAALDPASAPDAPRLAQRPLEKVQLITDAAEHRYFNALVDFAATAVDAVDEAAAEGNLEPDDKTFGPFSTPVAPMPEEEGAARLPNGADAASRQWYMITAWQTLGPFTGRGGMSASRLGLPTVAPPSADATYLDTRLNLGVDAETALTWLTQQADPEIRLTAEQWNPLWVTDAGLSGYGTYERNLAIRAVESSGRSYSWYAHTTLESPDARTVWLSVEAVDFGQLWVNGRCVWFSGTDYNPRLPAVFPVKLVKGVNSLMMRSGKTGISYHPPREDERSRFTLYVNPGGTPSEQLVAIAAETADAVAGYNTRGARRYPDAVPPLAWDRSDADSVVWSFRVSGGAPVLFADRVYVQSHNHELVCLDKRSGGLLWRAETEKNAGEASDEGTPAAVPVVTKDGIWCSFGSGVVAHFAHDGTLRWQINTGLTYYPIPHHDWCGGLSFAPLLYDGRLLVAGYGHNARGQAVRHDFVALEAATGREIWRYSTPHAKPGAAVLALSNGGVQRYIVVSGDGCVLDGVSGNLLFEDVTAKLPVMPLPVDDRTVLFARAAGQVKVTFWIDAAGRINARRLWDKRRGIPHGGYQGLIDGDRIYLPRVADEHHHLHPVPWGQLDVYDLAGGQHLAKPKPAIRDGLSPLSLTLAGNYIVFSDSGGAEMGIGNPRAQMSFYSRGDDPMQVAYIDFGAGRLNFSPLFEGERMYLSLDDSLMCVSDAKGGEALRRERIAQTLLREIPRRPQPVKYEALAAVKTAPPPTVPRATLQHGVMPDEWLACGPLPAAQAAIDADKLPRISSGALLPGAAQRIKDADLLWKVLDDESLIHTGLSRQMRGDGRFLYVPQHSLDVIRAMRNSPHSALWLYTVLRNDTPGVYRLMIKGNASDIHLAGNPVKNGDYYRLERGWYPLLMRMDLGAIPPGMRISFLTAFQAVRDPLREIEDWRTMLRRRRGALEEVVRLMPDTEYSRLAQAFLNEIE